MVTVCPLRVPPAQGPLWFEVGGPQGGSCGAGGRGERIILRILKQITSHPPQPPLPHLLNGGCKFPGWRVREGTTHQSAETDPPWGLGTLSGKASKLVRTGVEAAKLGGLEAADDVLERGSHYEVLLLQPQFLPLKELGTVRDGRGSRGGRGLTLLWAWPGETPTHPEILVWNCFTRDPRVFSTEKQ